MPICEDLKSVSDLPKYWRLFKDPEDSNKGIVYLGTAGVRVFLHQGALVHLCHSGFYCGLEITQKTGFWLGNVGFVTGDR